MAVGPGVLAGQRGGDAAVEPPQGQPEPGGEGGLRFGLALLAFAALQFGLVFVFALPEPAFLGVFGRGAGFGLFLFQAQGGVRHPTQAADDQGADEAEGDQACPFTAQ